MPNMTTENGREKATLEREGAYSAYASTRCIPYALGSGRFENRKKNETHARGMDIFLQWERARVSRVRCPRLPLGRTAPVPKYLILRRPGRPVVIQFSSGSLPTVLLPVSANTGVHVVAPVPPGPVAERAPRVPPGASCGIILLVPGLGKSRKFRRGSTRRGRTARELTDTDELARREWHTWPVTRSRSVVRKRSRPVTG